MAKRKTLTVDDVKEAIKGIKEEANAGDFEGAHGSEICLYKEVLKAIEGLCKNAVKDGTSEVKFLIIHDLAREALKASKIKFTRVTA